MRSARSILPLVLLATAVLVAPSGISVRAQQTQTGGKVRLGKVSVLWPSGIVTLDQKDRKRPVWTVSGPKVTVRSEGADLDARHVEARFDYSKKGQKPVTGELEGAVRIVLRSEPGVTDTLTCERATFGIDGESGIGKITIPGAVRWVHVGPELEEPSVLNAGSGSVTLRGKVEGPLIELSDGGLTATPRERKPEKKSP